MEPRSVSQPTLADHLQMLREQQSTCALWVSDGASYGQLSLEHGEVIGSQFGDLHGPAALEALLAAADAISYGFSSASHATQSDDESMVVPRGMFAEQRENPDASLRKDLASVVSEFPPALEQGDPLGTRPLPPEAAPALPQEPRISLTLADERARLTPPPPAESGSRRVRFAVGALLGAGLLSAIIMGRAAEEDVAQAKAHAAAAAAANPAPAEAPKSSAEAAPAAPTAQAAEPIIPPTFEAGDTPEAPRGALAATIPVRLLVGADGRVKQAELAARREGLGAVELQAVEAARTYRFQPPTQGGKPVEAWLTVPVRFRPTPALAQVIVKGSDTIGQTLLPAWVDALRAKNRHLSVQVETLGSTTGLAALLDGSADIAASSRLIRTDELALAEKFGMQLREVMVGYDGVSLIVHPNNPLPALDMDQLARIYTGQVVNWRELGGPDAPIRVLGRPGYSGTQRLFKERVLTRLGPDVDFGPKLEILEHGREIVDAVASDVNTLGYVGLGQVRQDVRVVPLVPAPSTEPLLPTAATIGDSSYPLSRPLMLYLRPDSGEAAHALVDFVLGDAGQALVEQSGFVRLPAGLPTGITAEGDARASASRPEVVRIYFDPGSAWIAKDSLPDLAAAAAAIRPHRSIVVVGNADSRGQPEYNRLLAQQRVEVVAARLRELGSREASITVQVAAADHPIASNATAAGRRANRRVDVIFVPSSR